jgi:polyisoprenoid-binding protein YceI
MILRKILLFLIIFSSINVNAIESKKWKINSDHSELIFNVDYLLVSNVTGLFKSFLGDISFDEDGELPNLVEFIIFSESIFTNNDIRDGHLKSQKFFWTEKFPVIDFKSQSIKPKSPGKFVAKGLLKIKDLNKEVEVTISISNSVKDTWGYESKFITFETIINRNEWGLDWNKGLQGNKILVGSEVRVSGKFQIQPYQMKTPRSKHMLPNTKYINLRDQLKQGEITQKEFSKLSQSKNEASQNNNEKSNKAITLTYQNTNITKEVTDKREETLLWRVCFWFMAFFGFCSSFFIPFHFKLMVSEKAKEKYNETGVIGFFTDIPMYILGILYFAAVYIVGYSY